MTSSETTSPEARWLLRQIVGVRADEGELDEPALWAAVDALGNPVERPTVIRIRVAARLPSIVHARAAGCTYRTIAAEHGLSVERIRQQYAIALRRLRIRSRTFFQPPKSSAQN